jgi:hypothetical protein
LPICRATSAAWLVIPPKAVRNPSDAFIPRMSSGLVSWRARITVSPRAFQSPLARSRPVRMADSFAASSKMGRRTWFSDSGSTRRMASSREMSFSSTMATAMRTAARPVRLPVRVCRT